jgi:outer membrane receptor protein involved in Fe transport
VWLRYTGVRPDIDPVTFAIVDAPARTLVGLSVQRKLTPHWTLGLKVDNAADSRVPEVLGYTAAPREFLVTLRGQWQ